MKIYRPGALRSVLVAVGVLLVYTTGVFARQRCGIRVDIRNASAETLTQVRVRVGGIGDRWKNYRVADIRAGGRARIYVQPSQNLASALNLQTPKASHTPTVSWVMLRPDIVAAPFRRFHPKRESTALRT